MKAEITITGQTNNRVIPCDHDDRDECTKLYTIKTADGVERTDFCEAQIRADVRLDFRLSGSSVSVKVNDGEHWFSLAHGQIVELDAFIQVIRDRQFRREE